MSNGPLGGNMGTPPVAPQPPQVSFTTTAESRGGFNNFLKSIPSTTAMTPLPPMGSPQMMPPMGGNPMGNIDIFNQPPSMGMGMMGMNQPQMNPMMQPPMQPPMMNQQPMMMAEGGGVPPRRTEIMGQDHMLSYITPEEGGILKALGGSGAPGPMGIPSFFDDDDDDDAQDYSDGSGSQDTGNVEDSYSGDYTGGGNDNNDNEPFDDGGGRPEDYGLTQQDFTDASNVGESVFNESQGNRTNIVNVGPRSNLRYDPQFTANNLQNRGLDPSGFMGIDNFGQTTQGMQAATQAQRDAELSQANMLSGRSMPTMGDLGASQNIAGAIAPANIASGNIASSSVSPQAFGLGLDLDDPLGLGINTGFGPAADAARNREALTGAFGTPDYRQEAGLPTVSDATNTNAMFTGPEDDLMSGRSRGASINNPGNIRGGFGGDNQIGTTPDGFAIFDNLQSGKDAIGTLANTYGDKYGINTIDAFNQRYSPVGSENTQAAVDTKNQLMADALGVDLNANVDFTDPNVQGKITNAVMQSEIGKQGMQDVNALTGLGLSQVAPTAPDPMATDRSPGRMSAVFGPEIASTFGGLTPNEVMGISGITSPGQKGEIAVKDNGFVNRQLSSLVNKTLGRDDFVNPEDRTTDIFSPSASDFANFQATTNQLPNVDEEYPGDAFPGKALTTQNVSPQNTADRIARNNRSINEIRAGIESGNDDIYTGNVPQYSGNITPDTSLENMAGRRDAFTNYDSQPGYGPTDTVFDIDTRDTRNFVGDDFEPALDIFNQNVLNKDVVDDEATFLNRVPNSAKIFGGKPNTNVPTGTTTRFNSSLNDREDTLGVLPDGRMSGIENLYKEPMTFEKLGLPPGMFSTALNFVESKARDFTAADLASGNFDPIYDRDGKITGSRNPRTGQVQSGMDFNAPDTGSNDNDDPLILRPIAKAKEEEKEEEDKPPNVIGGGETPAPVSSGSVVVDSPFTSNVGNFIPSSFNTGELNKLIAALTGVSAPRAMKQGGVAGYAEGGRVMQALDNLLATG